MENPRRITTARLSSARFPIAQLGTDKDLTDVTTNFWKYIYIFLLCFSYPTSFWEANQQFRIFKQNLYDLCIVEILNYVNLERVDTKSSTSCWKLKFK